MLPPGIPSAMITGDDCSAKEIRHPTLYFPDGDIVLCAPKIEGSETVTVLFRIDKIYLYRSSVVFKDLLSIPPQPNANELYDGVVRVHIPDSADDLEHLLTTLYDVSSLELKVFDPAMPIKVMGSAKMATKYQIDSVRNIILRSLKESWPQTLEQWEHQHSLLETVRARCKRQPDGKISGQFLDDMFPEPASAIRLALECDCPEILPSAFYQLALIEATSDWDKCRSMHSPLLATQGRTARWYLLDRETLWRVFSGKARIKQLGQVIGPLTEPSKCRVHSCGPKWRELEESARTTTSDRDPLHYLQLLQDRADSESSNFCTLCRTHASGIIRAARQVIWDKLSELFELEPMY